MSHDHLNVLRIVLNEIAVFP